MELASQNEALAPRGPANHRVPIGSHCRARTDRISHRCRGPGSGAPLQELPPGQARRLGPETAAPRLLASQPQTLMEPAARASLQGRQVPRGAAVAFCLYGGHLRQHARRFRGCSRRSAWRDRVLDQAPSHSISCGRPVTSRSTPGWLLPKTNAPSAREGIPSTHPHQHRHQGERLITEDSRRISRREYSGEKKQCIARPPCTVSRQSERVVKGHRWLGH